LPEVLRQAVGVQIKSLGGEFATVSIRGSTAEQVIVYLDGVPLNHALGGGVNLADVPFVSLDSVTIYRGATPAGLPEASIGGAVLLRSRAPAHGSGGSAFLGVGSYGSSETGGSWSFRHGTTDGMIAFDTAASDGDFQYDDGNGTDFDPTDDETVTRINNDFRRNHLSARAGSRAGNLNFTYGGDFFEREQGVPGIANVQSPDSRLHTSRMLLHAGVEAPGLAGGALLLRGRLSYVSQDQEYDNSQADSGLIVRRSDNRLDSTGLEAGGTWIASAHHGVGFLAAFRHETADLHDRLFDPSERAFADRDVLTATVEDTIALASGRVTVVPSLRHERWDSTLTPGPAPGVLPSETSTSDAATTGKIGLRVRAASNLEIRANAGSYLRVPDLLELYGDQGAIVGNPALEPESGRNLDLGATLSFQRPGARFHDLLGTLSGFATDADQMILFEANSQSTVIARNTGAARIRGVELDLGMALGARVTCGFNAVRQTAKDASGSYTDGNWLPMRARDEVSARAGLLAGRGRLAWEFTYVGPNFTDPSNNEAALLPSRYLHDLSYRWPVGAHMTATVEVRNVFDDLTVDVMRYPLPGRAFGGRLEWAF
ncbi:MAG TPA: TonB-dependent receptor, partial [Candidatus Polarisedimenticolia bacterium]|nr:TonB-dependent receptor [Candidatus Polarisedimenticolia bacterium]